MEASVRLAALFHDLGHFPFSHDFEFALKDYVANEQRARTPVSGQLVRICKGDPHENVGHALASLVFTALVEENHPDPACRAAFALARDILNSEEKYDVRPRPKVSALGWLHSLVDGQIDVDRADYLLRDARAVGFEFVLYDLDRLISNLVLVRELNLGYLTAVDERGLSALESFCLSRSRSNQLLVRHHKIAQFGAALRYATVAALKQTTEGAELIADLALLTKKLTPKDSRALLDRFARYDDPWWLAALRKVNPGGDTLLKACLDAFLDRQHTLFSVWKRKGNLTPRQLVRLNAFADSATTDQELFELRRKRLLSKQILCMFYRFRPYTFRSGEVQQSVLSISSEKGPETVLYTAASLSNLVRGLHTSWLEDVHVHAFSMAKSAVTTEQVVRDGSWKPRIGNKSPSSRRKRAGKKP